MARKISDNATYNGNRIFCIKSEDGYAEFVECESLCDLHKYIALKWIFERVLVSIIEIKYDGTEYKTIYEAETRKADLKQAIREIEAFGG
jgi:hypothetical protein